MEKFKITVTKDKEIHYFEVSDYPHHNSDRCKFEVYKEDVFIASFEPDDREYLRICKNTGKIENELLYLIADKIESYNW